MTLARVVGTVLPVAVKVTGSSPSTVTSTEFGPGVLPRVKVLQARPRKSVIAVSVDIVPSPSVTLKGT